MARHLFLSRPERRWRKRLGLLGLLALAAGLAVWWTRAQAQAGFVPDAARPHHTASGFQNRYGGNVQKGLWEVLRWQMRRQSPPLPDPPLPAATPDLAAPGPQVTWLGHSTVFARLGGLAVITDPHFSERASPVSWAGPRRAYPPPVALSALPHIDVVLISHNHFDHLDLPTVLALQAQSGGAPLFVVPLGLKAWLAGQGIATAQVVELDWWDHHTVQGVEFTLTPSQHWSSRTPFDARATLWGGFAVLAPDFHLLYTGDTAYSPDFTDIRAHFAPRHLKAQGGGFDLALIPVGCYEPRDFMRDQHVNPAEAARIFLDLGAKRAIGVHWGTFRDLCDEPLDQAPKDLAAARRELGIDEAAFSVLQRGETRRFEPR